MASSSAHDFFFQEANTLSFVHSLISRAWRHLDVTHVPLVNQVRDLFFIKSQKWFFSLHNSVFSWLLGCEGSGAIFHGLRRPACHQALLTRLKLCEKCGSNSCVRVFFIPWGHVNIHDHIWVFVTSMGSPDLNARFWLVETISAALWLVRTFVATMTTLILHCKVVLVYNVKND